MIRYIRKLSVELFYDLRIIVSVWLIFGFVAQEFDVQEWTTEGRAWAVAVVFLMGIFLRSRKIK